jgi:hypothetical protein
VHESKREGGREHLRCEVCKGVCLLVLHGRQTHHQHLVKAMALIRHVDARVSRVSENTVAVPGSIHTTTSTGTYYPHTTGTCGTLSIHLLASSVQTRPRQAKEPVFCWLPSSPGRMALIAGLEVITTANQGTLCRCVPFVVTWLKFVWKKMYRGTLVLDLAITPWMIGVAAKNSIAMFSAVTAKILCRSRQTQACCGVLFVKKIMASTRRNHCENSARFTQSGPRLPPKFDVQSRFARSVCAEAV